MDLLACPSCDRRFYALMAGTWDSRCPRCGSELSLALKDIASIPLDARGLDAPSQWAQQASPRQASRPS
jgi:hypothetical protein